MPSSQAVEVEDRHQRIAEAAYFRAEKRGFVGGDPVDDWVQAEHEVDAMLRRDEERQLVADFEVRLAAVRKDMQSLRRKVSSMAADAREELERDMRKLHALKDSFEKRLADLRVQGLEASHKAVEQAESLWQDIAETAARLGEKIRSRKKSKV